jgi:hypothetical protein
MTLIQSYGGARAASNGMKQMGTVTAKINYSRTGNFFMNVSCVVASTGLYGTIGVNWKHDNPSEADLAEQEFKRQEEAFKTRAENEPLFLSPYQDHFVIFYNGEILEHDRDLQSLTTRFFLNNPDVPAIIKKIGNNHPLIIDTPFFD